MLGTCICAPSAQIAALCCGGTVRALLAVVAGSILSSRPHNVHQC